MDIKQFALAVHNFAYGTNWDDEDIVSAMDFEMIVEKMKKDEKDLKWKLIETQGAVAFQQECVDGDKEALKKEVKELKEVKEGLAQKFYDHYGGQGADTLNFARQTGPNLGNMIDYVLKENKELKEQVEEAHQEGFDEGQLEGSVDREYLEEKDQEIEKLKETIRDQGDQLVVFHAKEEKPDTNSSTCVKVICEIKDDEIKQLKEQVKELKEDLEQNTTYAVLPEEGQFLDQLKELQEKYDHLRSVHSKVVQDLNARTEKVIELTLQHQ